LGELTAGYRPRCRFGQAGQARSRPLLQAMSKSDTNRVKTGPGLAARPGADGFGAGQAPADGAPPLPQLQCCSSFPAIPIYLIDFMAVILQFLGSQARNIVAVMQRKPF